tara:strand:+ start:525 stop:1721 length:1197 start_codon:yes stop_codon:yes gene_type:complete
MADLLGIFGVGRNGTTLLMRLLDGSPSLWVHPRELNYLSIFTDVAKYRYVRKITDHCAGEYMDLSYDSVEFSVLMEKYFRKDLNALQKLIEPNIDTRELEQKISQQWVNKRYRVEELLPHYLEFVRGLFDSNDDVPGNMIVFKSIETMFLSEYEQTFPNMKFIHIIRDPVDNYSSAKRTLVLRDKRPLWHLGGDSFRTIVGKRWIPHAKFLVESRESCGNRHIVTRYEDLTKSPIRELERICSELDIALPVDPGRLTMQGSTDIREEVTNPSMPGIQTPQRVVNDLGSRYHYDEVVSARERAIIRLVTVPLAAKIGYRSSDERVSAWGLTLLALRWLVPDRWDIVNVYGGPRLDVYAEMIVFPILSIFRLVRALITRRIYPFKIIKREILMRRSIRPG